MQPVIPNSSLADQIAAARPAADHSLDSFALLKATDFAGLRLAQFEVGLRAEEPAIIPNFPGSTLRGAFGHALKDAVCVVSHRDCSRCILASRCIYPFVFESTASPDSSDRLLRDQQNAPQPYTLDPPVYDRKLKAPAPVAASENDGEAAPRRPQWERHQSLAVGDQVVFGMTLLGRAVDHLPYLVFAIHEMTQRGMGKGRARFAISDVAWLEPSGARRIIYSGDTQRLEAPPDAAVDLSELIALRMERLAAAGAEGETVKLRFLTPTRIKTRNELQPRPDFALLTRSLLRRASMLMQTHGQRRLDLDFGGIVARAATIGSQTAALRWWDWGRYSGRQQTRMRMGGFVGEIVYDGGKIAEFLPLLAAGELLRVGNGTSFGLGKFTVAEPGEMGVNERGDG